VTILHTKRLRLEPFAEQHLHGLNQMTQHLEVMRFLGGEPETREQTAAGIARVRRCWAVLGTSWWAFVGVHSDEVVGAGCIQYLRLDQEIPADLESLRAHPLEIGWRLHPDFWGQGLASEAAVAMATHAFENLHAQELLAVRHPDNARSARVMDRLGMDFRGMERWYGTSLATHVISRTKWLQSHPAAGKV
jgi:RimJ/RimL family protein N-acetyltransferase